MIGIILVVAAMVLCLGYRHKLAPAPIQKPKKASVKKEIKQPTELFFSSLNDKETDAFISAYIRRNNLVKYGSFFQLKKELLLEFDESNPQLSDKLTEAADWKGDLMDNVRHRLKAIDLPNGEYYGVLNGNKMQLLEKNVKWYCRVRGFYCPTYFVVKNLRVISEKSIHEKDPMVRTIEKQIKKERILGF